MGSVEDVEEDGTIHIEQKNKFCVGDTIEIMKPDGRNIPAKVLKITDDEGNEQESCPHSRQKLRITLETAEKCDLFDILRVEA